MAPASVSTAIRNLESHLGVRLMTRTTRKVSLTDDEFKLVFSRLGQRLRVEDLRRLWEDAGFEDPSTYIARGNVVFQSNLAEPQVKAALEARLLAYAGKAVAVMVRTGDGALLRILRAACGRRWIDDHALNCAIVAASTRATSTGSTRHAGGGSSTQASSGRMW